MVRRVDVLFSTFNGSATLPTMLEAFKRLVTPFEWRVLVVDNGSRDTTREILEAFSASLPLEVLTQPRPGKNRALNVGLKAVRGDLIILTDDDIAPEPNWLVRLCAAADAQPNFALFGGAIRPRWPSPPPDWLLEEADLEMAYAVTGESMEAGPVHPMWVWGPSMAVRRDVFESGLRFDESVGPGPGDYIMGSETDFTNRAAAAGFRCWHVADAVVEHLVRPHQIEPSWVIERGFRAGRQAGRSAAKRLTTGSEGPLLLGYPRWRLRKWFEATTREFWHGKVTRNQRVWFRNAYARRFEEGVLFQLREARRAHNALT